MNDSFENRVDALTDRSPVGVIVARLTEAGDSQKLLDIVRCKLAMCLLERSGAVEELADTPDMEPGREDLLRYAASLANASRNLQQGKDAFISNGWHTDQGITVPADAQNNTEDFHYQLMYRGV